MPLLSGKGPRRATKGHDGPGKARNIWGLLECKSQEGLGWVRKGQEDQGKAREVGQVLKGKGQDGSAGASKSLQFLTGKRQEYWAVAAIVFWRVAAAGAVAVAVAVA